MHCTLPPLLGSEVMSLFVFLVTGKAAADLRPVKGATMLACAGEAVVATAADENMDEAMTAFFLSSSASSSPLLSSSAVKCSNVPNPASYI